MVESFALDRRVILIKLDARGQGTGEDNNQTEIFTSIFMYMMTEL